MSANATAILSVVVILVVAGGAVLALVGHLLFLRRLWLAHPELWAAYRRIAFTAAHSSAKHHELSDHVYSHLTDSETLHARHRDLIFRRIFAYSSLVSASSFAAWRIIPVLHQHQ